MYTCCAASAYKPYLVNAFNHQPQTRYEFFGDNTMPITNFKCAGCGKEFAKIYFSLDDEPKSCPVCKSEDITATGPSFKMDSIANIRRNTCSSCDTCDTCGTDNVSHSSGG